MLVDSFFEDEELTRTALSCHLSMDLLCQEMRAAWKSWACRKVGNKMLKWRCALAVLSSLLRKGGICPPDNWDAGVAQSRQPSTSSVEVSATCFHDATVSQSTFKDKQNRDEPAQDPRTGQAHDLGRPEAQMWRRVVANAADHWQFRREVCKDPRPGLTKRGDFRDFRTATCLMNIS